MQIRLNVIIVSEMDILDRSKMVELLDNPVMTDRMRDAFSLACDLFDTTQEKVLHSGRRQRNIIDVKKCFAMALIKNHWFSAELPKENEISIVTISKLLNIDHSTVVYYKKTFDGLCKTDKSFAEKFNKVMVAYSN